MEGPPVLWSRGQGTHVHTHPHPGAQPTHTLLVSPVQSSVRTWASHVWNCQNACPRGPTQDPNTPQVTAARAGVGGLSSESWAGRPAGGPGELRKERQACSGGEEKRGRGDGEQHEEGHSWEPCASPKAVSEHKDTGPHTCQEQLET